jgi:hypothetical protein
MVLQAPKAPKVLPVQLAQLVQQEPSDKRVPEALMDIGAILGAKETLVHRDQLGLRVPMEFRVQQAKQV